jgi:surfeit locus 1 family protein
MQQMAEDSSPAREGTPSSRARLILSGAMLLLVVVFGALGVWQTQRLFWKLDLIERVEARVNRAAQPLPDAADWPGINATDDEYRHVTATGIFDHSKAVLVQAVTELGAGFWVVTPLLREDGSTVLINRGFVPSDKRDAASRSAADTSGPVTISGLLRISEPDGGFLRSNDPAGGRWYSRDVDAIAKAESLDRVAPFFIDADKTANPGGLPVGGLTVVNFRNTHLVYALTWFAMALMGAAGAFYIYRQRSA